MNTEAVLEFDRLPAIAPAYLRAVTTLGGGLADGETIPSIAASVTGLRIDAEALARYNHVCGFADGQTLPVTYPHVLAFPVHMAVLTHRTFPLKLLGLVHVRNEISQHRRIGVDETLDLRVSTGGHREKHNGIEFDLATEATDAAGETVWASTSTMLSRGGGSGRRSGRPKKPEDDVPAGGQQSHWRAPADIGRRYARAAGDVNPIHLSALSAKLFGFPCAIAHGMWLKARTAAAIADAIDSERYSINVAFKKPVLLPGDIHLTYNPTDSGIDFALVNKGGDVTHMVGDVTYS